MGQLIVVYVIGAVALIYVVWRLYGVFFRGASPCADCKGCELQSVLKDSTKFNKMSSEQRSTCNDSRELSDTKHGKRRSSKGGGSGCGCG